MARRSRPAAAGAAVNSGPKAAGRGRRWALAAVAIAAAGGGGWLARAPWRGGATLPTAMVRRGNLDEYVRCRGQLAVRHAALLIIPPEIDSLRILFAAPGGSQVKAGQAVIRLDVSGLAQKARQLELALQAAEAKLRQARTQAAITQQQDLLALVEDQVQEGQAQLAAQRDSILSRIAGQEGQLDLATAQAEVAAQQAQARLHAAAAAQQMQALRAARDKAAGQLRRERAAVAAATLRAPIAGLVSYMMNYSNFNDPHPYRVGDMVSAGDEIAQIPDLATLEARGELPQNDRGRVRAGDRVQVRVAALPETQFAGRLTRISALTKMDFGGTFPPPRDFQLVAPLIHPDARLRPQMGVTLRIITRQLRQVALVPAQAVFTRRGQATVYVERGGAFQARAVTVLGRNPAEAAVRGVLPGQRVALVAPGAKPQRGGGTAPPGTNPANAAGAAQ